MEKVNVVHVREGEREWETWENRMRGNVRWRTLLSADRTPSDSITCGIAELADEKLELHRHSHAEVYHVLSGKGVVSVDGKEFEVGAGSTVFIPGNALHGVKNRDGNVLRLLYVFAADSFEEIEYVFPHEEMADG